MNKHDTIIGPGVVTFIINKAWEQEGKGEGKKCHLSTPCFRNRTKIGGCATLLQHLRVCKRSASSDVIRCYFSPGGSASFCI